MIRRVFFLFFLTLGLSIGTNYGHKTNVYFHWTASTDDCNMHEPEVAVLIEADETKTF